MYFKRLLVDHEEILQGDFFRLFEINEMKYIIFKNEKNIISCIELCGFKEVKPIELSILINKIDINTDEGEEFIFDKSISVEKLISYLFEVEKVEGNQLCKVGNDYGVLLYDNFQKKTTRNLFQNKLGLKFENKLALNCFEKTEEVDCSSITFSVQMYKRAIENDDIKGVIYLLGSAAPYLLEKIMNQNKELNILLSDADLLQGLSAFIYHYNRNADKEKMGIYFDNSQISISFSDEISFEDVINIVTSANKNLREIVGNSEIKNLFDVRRVNEYTFVNFKNIHLLIKTFFLAVSQQEKNIHLIF